MDNHQMNKMNKMKGSVYLLLLFLLLSISGCGAIESYVEKKDVEASASMFIEAFLKNDYDMAKDFMFFEENEDSESNRESFKTIAGFVGTFFSLGQAFAQAFTGVKPQISYTIKDVRLVNTNTARLTYVFGSNVSNEKYNIDTTLIKEGDVWKVHFLSFKTSLMF